MATKPLKLTAFQIKALTAIRDNPGIRARELSHIYWPDAPGHRRHGKAGPHGSVQGSGMWIAAGCQTGKLVGKGWAVQRWKRVWAWHKGKMESWYDGYHLTQAGRKALAEAVV